MHRGRGAAEEPSAGPGWRHWLRAPPCAGKAPPRAFERRQATAYVAFGIQRSGAGGEQAAAVARRIPPARRKIEVLKPRRRERPGFQTQLPIDHSVRHRRAEQIPTVDRGLERVAIHKGRRQRRRMHVETGRLERLDAETFRRLDLCRVSAVRHLAFFIAPSALVIRLYRLDDGRFAAHGFGYAHTPEARRRFFIARDRKNRTTIRRTSVTVVLTTASALRASVMRICTRLRSDGRPVAVVQFGRTRPLR